MNAGDLAHGAVFTLAGLLVGWVYFALVRWSVCAMTAGTARTGRFVLLLLPRLALLGAGIYAAARCGWGFLLAYTLGFFAARGLMVARARAAIQRDAAAADSQRHT